MNKLVINQDGIPKSTNSRCLKEAPPKQEKKKCVSGISSHRFGFCSRHKRLCSAECQRHPYQPLPLLPHSWIKAALTSPLHRQRRTHIPTFQEHNMISSLNSVNSHALVSLLARGNLVLHKKGAMKCSSPWGVRFIMRPIDGPNQRVHN